MTIYKTCLSLFGKTEEIVEAIRSNDADLYEIRMDLSSEIQPAIIRQTTRKPLIFTAHEQPELLRQAAPYAEYLDAGSSVLPPGPFRQILSYHGKESVPETFLAAPTKALKKIVVETGNYSNIFHLMELNRRPSVFAFAIGEIGSFSRMVSIFQGAPWIYTSLPGRLTAGGQFTLQELNDVYRLGRFDAAPAIFGIIGDPVRHSKSPQFHNDRFKRDQKPWIYLPFLCKDLKGLLEFAPRFGIRGFSITHPFKEEVLPLLSQFSNDVRLLNACNTIFHNEESWEGINTDVDGARAVAQKIGSALAQSRVILLGAGGAARAIAAALARQVKELMILNRTQSKAAEIAQQFGARSGSLGDFNKFDYDILIQATSVGMRAEESPVDPATLKAEKIVIDLIYNPPKTALLKKAEALGCTTFNGEDWFEAQAEAQYKWWETRMSASRILK